MAITFVAESSFGSLTATTCSWPTGHQSGDLGILAIETDGAGTTLTPSGWTHFSGSPVTDVADANGSKLHLLYKFATSSSESDVSIADSGNHQLGGMTCWRGVASSSFTDGIATYTKSTASTSLTLPSVTTTGANRLILMVMSRPNDSATAQFSLATNSNLSSITEISDGGGTTGNGGGIGLQTGLKATAGSTGTTSVSQDNSITNAGIVVALVPAATVYTLNLNSLSLSNTAQQLSLEVNRKLELVAASLALTAQQLTLAKSYQLDLNTGSLAITARDIEFRRHLDLNLNTLALALTPQSLGMRQKRRLELALGGPISLTPLVLDLRRKRLLDLNSGALSLTPQSLTLRRKAKLNLNAGSLSLTSLVLTLTYKSSQVYTLQLQPISLSLTPQQLSLLRRRRLDLNAATIAATPQQLSLRRRGRLDLGALGASLSPLTLSLVVRHRLGLQPASLGLTGHALGLLRRYPLVLNARAITINAQPLTLTQHKKLNLESLILTLEPQLLQLNYSEDTEDYVTIYVNGQPIRVSLVGLRTEVPWWEGDYRPWDPRYVLRQSLGRTYDSDL